MSARTHAPFTPWPLGPLESVILRVLFAIVVFQSMPLGEPFDRLPTLSAPVPLLPNARAALPFQGQPYPNGLAHWIDVTPFSNPVVVWTLGWTCVPALMLYAAGRGLPFVLPFLTAASIVFGTLRNSQGAIAHQDQIVSMILLAQSAVVVVGALRSMGSGRTKRRDSSPGNSIDARLHYAALLVIVASYLTAGVSKIERSDGAWLENSHLIGIQVVKTYRQNFYNDLDAERFGKPEVPYAEVILAHPDLSRVVLAGGLFLELCAFLALYDRRSALLFGLLFIAFHRSIALVLGLEFQNHEKVVWIFLVDVPYWLGRLGSASRPRRWFRSDRVGSRTRAPLRG